jgi:cold shock CspA family protein
MHGVGPGRYLGLIKSFSKEKGFGFIDCPEIRARYNRDVFIHKQQMTHLEVGQEITFSIEENKEGRPQAREIERFHGPPLPRDGRQQHGYGAMPGKGRKQNNRRGGMKQKRKAEEGTALVDKVETNNSDNTAPDGAKALDAPAADAADDKVAPEDEAVDEGQEPEGEHEPESGEPERAGDPDGADFDAESDAPDARSPAGEANN